MPLAKQSLAFVGRKSVLNVTGNLIWPLLAALSSRWLTSLPIHGRFCLPLLVRACKKNVPKTESYLFFCGLSTLISQAKQPSSQPASRYWSGQEGTRAIRNGTETASITNNWLANKANDYTAGKQFFQEFKQSMSHVHGVTLLWSCSHNLEHRYPTGRFFCHMMQLWGTKSYQPFRASILPIFLFPPFGNSPFVIWYIFCLLWGPSMGIPAVLKGLLYC